MRGQWIFASFREGKWEVSYHDDERSARLDYSLHEPKQGEAAFIARVEVGWDL